MPTFPRRRVAAAPSSFSAALSSVNQFSRDEWFEILVRLPAITIFKFRTLSKFHRNLIDSPDFVRKPSDLLTKTTWTHVIVSQRISNNNTVDCAVKFDSADIDRKFTKEESFRANLSLKKGYSVVGSCKGIICLTRSPSKGPHEIMLWNPMTGDSRTFFADPCGGGYPLFTYFLGHDAVTDELKVVRISHRKLETENRANEYVIEIYSSKTGLWRKVPRANQNRVKLDLFFGGVFVEGTNSLHFLTQERSESIIAFDFTTERFGQIALPAGHAGGYADGVHCLNGCLSFSKNALFSCSEHRMYIWRMEEYGVVESWAPVYSLWNALSLRGIIPIHVVNDGRQVLFSTPLDCDKYLVLFCMDTGTKHNNKRFKNDIVLTKENSATASPRHFLHTPSLRRP